MDMRDWTGNTFFLISLVPYARAKLICHHYPSEDDQRKQAAAYYVNVHLNASWEDLARWLYEYEEDKAIEAFKARLPKPIGNQ